MKLCTFYVDAGFGGYERLGLVTKAGTIVDLNTAYSLLLFARDEHPRSYELADVIVPPDLIEFLRNREFGRDAVAEILESFEDELENITLEGPSGEPVIYSPEDVELVAPLPRPNSIRQGLAFPDHMRAIRSDRSAIPDYWAEAPVYYKANPDSVDGPDGEIVMPSYTQILDYELCIAAVVGADALNVSAAEAWDVIAGYTIFNDFTARDVLAKEMSCGLGPAKAKDMDGGNVFGPYLVSADSWDPRDGHAMIARVNGEEWSRATTRDMQHDFGSIVAHASNGETLRSGDVFGSGAAGCGWQEGHQLKVGDVVELEVEGLGILRTSVVAP
jgi:2-keto-4-pentenoate hydratase/2-oxohepta-3-ene-1,7-dioic acid hydratase in catechol pathway